MKDCLNDKHKERDNSFGVTWCIKCGKLFNKPVFKQITEEDLTKFQILTMKKHTKPFLNQLENSFNWLYNQAPVSVAWLVTALIALTLFATCSCTNPLIPEPIEPEIVDINNGLIISPDDTVHLIPVEKAGMKLCSCNGGIAGGETIGVICSNNQFLFLGQHLGQHCMCGNFYVKYWVCKRKKEAI